MSESTPETDYYGFTRISQGESLSKNGYAATDSDAVVQDILYHALEMHTHDGTARLSDPATAPSLTSTVGVGSLPAATPLYYVVSYVDRYGLETAMSPEQTITTVAQLATPSTPGVSAVSTGGGFSAGVYAYVITFTTASGGETTASSAAQLSITTGTTNQIRLVLPSLPTGANAVKLYRRRPGQGVYYYLTQIYDVTAPYFDSGSAEDQSITAPAFNTTNNNSSVTVTIPGGTIPPNVFAWKIYRAVTPGGYDGTSLVHEVVEPTTEFGTDLRTTWVDDGSALLNSAPRLKSSTVTGGIQLSYSQLNGTVPLAALPRGARSMHFFVPAIGNNLMIAKTVIPQAITPTEMTAFFQTASSGLGVGATPATLTFQVTDSASNSLTLACTDDTGYYKRRYLVTGSGSQTSVQGTRPSQTLIAQDVTATTGQSVALALTGDYVDFDFGTLDPGQYQMTVRMRLSAAGAFDVDTYAYASGAPTVALADTNNLNPSTGYTNLAGPLVTITTPTDVVFRVTKTTNSSATYLVDSVYYQATSLITLQPGDITVTSVMSGQAAASYGANANVTLWY